MKLIIVYHKIKNNSSTYLHKIKNNSNTNLHKIKDNMTKILAKHHQMIETKTTKSLKIPQFLQL